MAEHEENDAMSSAKELAAVDGGLLSHWSFRNRLVNGSFNIWQENTAFASPANGAYTADQWKVHYDGSGAFFVSRDAHSDGQPGRYRLKWDQSAAVTGGTFRVLQAVIENVRNFAGGKVTLSFTAWATGFTSLPIYLTQKFGTGGSPSPDNAFAVGTATLSSTPQRFKMTVDVPSISGKTLGSNLNDYLALSFNLPTSGTFVFNIEEVQIEAGEAATPFERIPPALELINCQRYYEKSFDLSVNPAQNAGVSGGSHAFPQVAAGAVSQSLGSVRFNTAKRAAPAMTFFNPSAANAQARNVTTGTDFTLTTAANAGTGGFSLTGTGPSGGTAGNLCQVHWVANARIA